jgi:HK97 gp10 family phage protein
MAIRILLDTKELDRISAKLGKSRNAIVRRAAFEVESEAKQNAPYDTTALRNSIYTVTKGSNGYSKASNSAKSKRTGIETEAHPTPPEGSAYVGPCVGYAEFVEFGTSRMAAQPYLTPAAEHVMQKYNSGDAWKELCE